eukprot:8584110-Karenia_brevis.AAC.1
MDVFADFYSCLYNCENSQDANNSFKDESFVIPPVSTTEVRDQLNQMRKGRSSDRKGIVVEMLQHG